MALVACQAVLVLLVGSGIAAANDGEIRPAEPKPFDEVHLRLPARIDPTNNSACYRQYDVDSREVDVDGNTIKVSVRVLTGIVVDPIFPECRQEYFVALGSFVRGQYTVQLTVEDGDALSAEYSFTIDETTYNDASAPAFDYTGWYWNPAEDGSGLHVLQNGSTSLSAVWETYDAEGNQAWYLIAGGSWAGSGGYVDAIVYRTANGSQGLAALNSTTEPADVERIGTGSLRFGGAVAGASPFILDLAIAIDGGETVRRRFGRFKQ